MPSPRPGRRRTLKHRDNYISDNRRVERDLEPRDGDLSDAETVESNSANRMRKRQSGYKPPNEPTEFKVPGLEAADATVPSVQSSNLEPPNPSTPASSSPLPTSYIIPGYEPNGMNNGTVNGTSSDTILGMSKTNWIAIGAFALDF